MAGTLAPSGVLRNPPMGTWGPGTMGVAAPGDTGVWRADIAWPLTASPVTTASEEAGVPPWKSWTTHQVGSMFGSWIYVVKFGNINGNPYDYRTTVTQKTSPY